MFPADFREFVSRRFTRIYFFEMFPADLGYRQAGFRRSFTQIWKIYFLEYLYLSAAHKICVDLRVCNLRELSACENLRELNNINAYLLAIWYLSLYFNALTKTNNNHEKFTPDFIHRNMYVFLQQ